MLLVLVVYNKKISDLSFFSQSIDNPISVFVYDNSNLAQKLPKIKNVIFYYEHDPSNSGVSRAYNQGAKLAKEMGFEKILLLDQDSKFQTSSMVQYANLYKKYGDQYIYAPIVIDKMQSKIYSPGYLTRFVGKPQVFKNFRYQELSSLNGMSLINSGNDTLKYF